MISKPLLLCMMLSFPLMSWAENFSLFHPVPHDQMRPFDSDRPGFTDSPRSVDAGHVQIELGLFGYAVNRAHSTDASDLAVTTTQKTSNFGSLEARLGLTDKLEIQFMFDGDIQQNTKTESIATDQTSSASGLGNTGLRLKWNLVGNGAAPFSLGLVPFVYFPTGASDVSDRQTEEGLNLPMAAELPHEFWLNVMPGWARRTNADGKSLHSEFSTGLIIGRDLCENLGAFAQVFETASDETGSSPAVGSGLGLTLKSNADLQWDVGANFGLSDAADVYAVIGGVVVRY